MERKRLSRILAKAGAADVAALAAPLRERYKITVVRGPGRTLARVKIREPVKRSLFYIGEVFVTEAVVDLEGALGAAVAMGEDGEKTLNMAIIDAACKKGVFNGWETLLRLQAEQEELERKRTAMHLDTAVNFSSLDRKVAT